MKNVLLTLATTLTLFSCGVPEPIPESIATVEDSIPTIVLSDTTMEETDYPIQVLVGSNGLHLADGYTTIDRLGEVTSIELRIQNDSIIYLRVNDAVEFGESAVHSSNYNPPFKLLDNNKILVMEGATLQLIARYYNKKISTLKMCNSIKNINYIEAGTVLKLSCCDECK
jgi:hypothetical protein